MESPYTWTLITLALVAMALSWNVPRAWWWIGAGGASFFVSTLYYDYGGNHHLHPILTLSCDSLVCIALFFGAKEKWELLVFGSFWLSVLSSLLMIGGFIASQIMYASLLEVFNLCAILAISGTGIVQMIGEHGHSNLFHNFNRYLHSARNSIR
jgi:hypothetical protein